MTRFIRHSIRQTDEEKAANKIGEIFSDFRLDLESVGYYLSRVLPHLIFTRTMIAFDAAEFYKSGGDINEFNYEDRGM
jgi:hypothetical protein